MIKPRYRWDSFNKWKREYDRNHKKSEYIAQKIRDYFKTEWKI